ncbi:hypothetical protein SUDANB145_07072 [Streptomyces sp. enrichment culture]|uniref:hypothetical protein n=1 Tax=Streptomyces sp. enrichment culture TaxID=1795815 RepID=UPI003F56DF8E
MELAHDGRAVTAVAAVRAADGGRRQAVAAAAGRVARLWRLDGVCRSSVHRDLPLGGEASRPARALSLVGAPAAGILRLSAADGRPARGPPTADA